MGARAKVDKPKYQEVDPRAEGGGNSQLEGFLTLFLPHSSVSPWGRIRKSNLVAGAHGHEGSLEGSFFACQ